MTEQLWLAVLSSSLISGVLGAGIAGLFALRVKRHEYVNEYYRSVLSRRMASYEQVERLITMLKTAVMDKDQRPYHILFTQEEKDVYSLLFGVMANALWLSDDLFDKTRELNVLFYERHPGDDNPVEFGKAHYRTIAELRTQIERIHARDMLQLHEMPRFLKSKKPKDTYGPIQRATEQTSGENG
jgi:hypothetical protein